MSNSLRRASHRKQQLGMMISNFMILTLISIAMASEPGSDGGSGARDGDENGFTVAGDYHLPPGAGLVLENGTLRLGGDFDVEINDSARFDMTTATLELIGLPWNGPQLIEVLSEDVGGCFVTLPDRSLFSFERLRVGPSPTTARLVDRRNNSGGVRNEAFYVDELILEPNTTLDLNGLWLYYKTIQPADPYAPGSGVRVIDNVGGGGLMNSDTAAPEIIEQPEDQSVCAGSTVVMSVDVVGAQPISYQWRQNGMLLDGYDPTYTIVNAAVDNAGFYDVIVFNDCGLAISNIAFLDVFDPDRGDVNGDGRVNGLDIRRFIGVLRGTPNGPPSSDFCAADLDKSGSVGTADLAAFIALLLGI